MRLIEVAINTINDDKSIKDYCTNLCHFGDDVYQEMQLALCELPETKLEQIIEGGWLKFWAIRVCTNMSRQHQLSRQLRHHKENGNVRIEDDARGCYEIELQIDAIIKLEQIESYLLKIHWYESSLFKLYLEKGSFRAVQDDTGINFQSVRWTVNKVYEGLNKLFDENINRT
jgi:hypothetical protein